MGDLSARRVDDLPGGRPACQAVDTKRDPARLFAKLDAGHLFRRHGTDVEDMQMLVVTIADPEGDVVPIYDRTRGIFGDVLTNPQVGFTPTITITNPFSGTIIESPEFTVSWAVEGATPAQVRRYEFQVLYSHNGGRIWAPLAVNLPGFLSEVSIPREQLCTTQALNGEKFPGILRVVGSDGLNSGYVDVYISLLGDQSEYCERGPVRAIDIPLSESGSLLDNIDTGTRNQSPVDTNGGSINQ